MDLLLPSQSSSIGFSLNESFTLFQHRHLGLQLTSLALIYFYLQNDLDHLKTISNTPISSKSSSSITPVVSAVKAGKKLKKQSKIEKESPSNSDKKSAVSSSSWVYHPQTVIEICQNGYLRQLCWCLIHPQAPIRSLALKVFVSSPQSAI